MFSADKLLLYGFIVKNRKISILIYFDLDKGLFINISLQTFLSVYQTKMHKDRFKAVGSAKKKQFAEYLREQSNEYLQKPSPSPKKKHLSPQFTRKNYFDEEPLEENNYLRTQKVQHKLNCEKDARLSALIYEAISSADRAIKLILNYDIPEIEGMCSKYFLGKQKLYAYLHSQTTATRSPKQKISRLSKVRSRKQDYSEEKEEVSLKQLKRLEYIVENKIIPLLKEQLYRDRKKYSKITKQMDVANPEQREGLYLLQRLNQKGKRFNLNDYIEVLQKYIMKVMDKQNNLMEKISELQQNLEKQTLKVEEYQNFIKKRQEEKYQDGIERANELKRMVRYQQFIKAIQLMVKEEEQDYFVKEKQNLDALVQRIRKLLTQEHSQKKDQHAVNKKLQTKQSHSDSQTSKSQQVKHLKDVVRTLNNQIGSLKQQYEHLQDKLRTTNEQIAKVQSKEKKLTAQNQSSKVLIQKLTQQIHQRDKMLENITGKYDQELKQNYQNFDKLHQEKQKIDEQFKRQQEENQKLLKHIVQIEERNKQLAESDEKKEKDVEQLVQSLYSKEVELKQLNKSVENYECQAKFLNAALIQREQFILRLEQRVKAAEQRLLHLAKQPLNQQYTQQKKPQWIILKAQNQEGNNNEPFACVVDNLFISHTAPSHKRQDFIPGKRFNGSIEQPKADFQNPLSSPHHNKQQKTDILDIQKIKIQDGYTKQSVQQNKATVNQTETGVQTQNLFGAENFYESKVFQFMPQLKNILSRQKFVQQTINRSLIHQLKSVNSDKAQIQNSQAPTVKEEDIVNIQSSQRQPQQPEVVNDEMKKARIKKKLYNSYKDIGNLMNYHKEKLLNLEKLLKKTSSQCFSFGQQLLQTPNKRPLVENQDFIEHINQAPEKAHHNDKLDEQDVNPKGTPEAKQQPISKQQVYEMMILENMEENANLRQIISEINNKEANSNGLLSQYNDIKRKFNQLLSLNEQLQRQITHLKMNKQHSQNIIQKVVHPQNQRQAEQQENLHQNVVKITLQQQMSNQIQQPHQAVPTIQQTEKKPLDENIKTPQNKANQPTPSKKGYTWQDLIPEYFGQHERHRKKHQ